MIEYLLRTFTYGALRRIYVWGRRFVRFAAWVFGAYIVVMVISTLSLGKFGEHFTSLIKPAILYLACQGIDLLLVNAWQRLLTCEQRRGEQLRARA